MITETPNMPESFHAGLGEPLWQITIAGLPPTVNSYWRHTGRYTYVAPKAKRWKAEAVTVLRSLWRAKPLEQNVAVVLFFDAKSLRRMDTDNRQKSLLDTMTAAGIWQDDSQAVEIRARRRQGETDADTTTISIYELVEPTDGKVPKKAKSKKQV